MAKSAKFTINVDYKDTNIKNFRKDIKGIMIAVAGMNRINKGLNADALKTVTDQLRTFMKEVAGGKMAQYKENFVAIGRAMDQMKGSAQVLPEITVGLQKFSDMMLKVGRAADRNKKSWPASIKAMGDMNKVFKDLAGSSSGLREIGATIDKLQQPLNLEKGLSNYKTAVEGISKALSNVLTKLREIGDVNKGGINVNINQGGGGGGGGGGGYSGSSAAAAYQPYTFADKEWAGEADRAFISAERTNSGDHKMKADALKSDRLKAAESFHSQMTNFEKEDIETSQHSLAYKEKLLEIDRDTTVSAKEWSKKINRMYEEKYGSARNVGPSTVASVVTGEKFGEYGGEKGKVRTAGAMFRGSVVHKGIEEGMKGFGINKDGTLSEKFVKILETKAYEQKEIQEKLKISADAAAKEFEVFALKTYGNSAEVKKWIDKEMKGIRASIIKGVTSSMELLHNTADKHVRGNVRKAAKDMRVFTELAIPPQMLIEPKTKGKSKDWRKRITNHRELILKLFDTIKNTEGFGDFSEIEKLLDTVGFSVGGIADLVVKVGNDKAMVIDYKTGKSTLRSLEYFIIQVEELYKSGIPGIFEGMKPEQIEALIADTKSTIQSAKKAKAAIEAESARGKQGFDKALQPRMVSHGPMPSSGPMLPRIAIQPKEQKEVYEHMLKTSNLMDKEKITKQGLLDLDIAIAKELGFKNREEMAFAVTEKGIFEILGKEKELQLVIGKTIEQKKRQGTANLDIVRKTYLELKKEEATRKAINDKAKETKAIDSREKAKQDSSGAGGGGAGGGGDGSWHARPAIAISTGAGTGILTEYERNLSKARLEADMFNNEIHESVIQQELLNNLIKQTAENMSYLAVKETSPKSQKVIDQHAAYEMLNEELREQAERMKQLEQMEKRRSVIKARGGGRGKIEKDAQIDQELPSAKEAKGRALEGVKQARKARSELAKLDLDYLKVERSTEAWNQAMMGALNSVDATDEEVKKMAQSFLRFLEPLDLAEVGVKDLDKAMEKFIKKGSSLSRGMKVDDQKFKSMRNNLDNLRNGYDRLIKTTKKGGREANVERLVKPDQIIMAHGAMKDLMETIEQYRTMVRRDLRGTENELGQVVKKIKELRGAGKDTKGGKLTAEFKEMRTEAKILKKNVADLRKEQSKLAVTYTKTAEEAQKVNRHFGRYQKRAEKLRGSNRLNIEGFKDMMKSQAAWVAGYGLLYGAMRSFREAIMSTVELQQQLARAMRTVRSEMLSTADATFLFNKSMQDTMVRLGATSETVGEVLYQLGSAGLKAGESLAALNSTMDAIVGTEADVTAYTKAVAAVYNNFSGTIQGATTQSKEFLRINDIMVATYRDHQVEMNELTEGMKHLTAMGKESNLSFTEMAGILGTLNDHMIKSGMAGRSVQSVLSRISRQGKAFAEAFNIDIDPTEQMDFLKILQDVNKQFMTGALSAEKVGTIFEKLGLRGAKSFIVLARNVDKLTNNIQKLNSSAGGAAEVMQEIMTSTPEGEVIKLGQSFALLVRWITGAFVEITALSAGALNPMISLLRSASDGSAGWGTGLMVLVRNMVVFAGILTAINLLMDKFIGKSGVAGLQHMVAGITKAQMAWVYWGAAIGGIIAIIQGVVWWMGRAERKTRDLNMAVTEAQQVFTESRSAVKLASKNLENYVEILANNYDETLRNIDAQNRLAAQIPQLISTYDQLGNAVLKSKKQLTEMTEAEAERLEQLKSIQHVELGRKMDTQSSAGDNALAGLEKAEKAYKNFEKNREDAIIRLEASKAKGGSEGELSGEALIHLINKINPSLDELKEKQSAVASQHASFQNTLSDAEGIGFQTERVKEFVGETKRLWVAYDYINKLIKDPNQMPKPRANLTPLEKDLDEMILMIQASQESWKITEEMIPGFKGVEFPVDLVYPDADPEKIKLLYGKIKKYLRKLLDADKDMEAKGVPEDLKKGLIEDLGTPPMVKQQESITETMKEQAKLSRDQRYSIDTRKREIEKILHLEKDSLKLTEGSIEFTIEKSEHQKEYHDELTAANNEWQRSEKTGSKISENHQRLVDALKKILPLVAEEVSYKQKLISLAEQHKAIMNDLGAKRIGLTVEEMPAGYGKDVLAIEKKVADERKSIADKVRKYNVKLDKEQLEGVKDVSKRRVAITQLHSDLLEEIAESRVKRLEHLREKTEMQHIQLLDKQASKIKDLRLETQNYLTTAQEWEKIEIGLDSSIGEANHNLKEKETLLTQITTSQIDLYLSNVKLNDELIKNANNKDYDIKATKNQITANKEVIATQYEEQDRLIALIESYKQLIELLGLGKEARKEMWEADIPLKEAELAEKLTKLMGNKMKTAMAGVKTQAAKTAKEIEVTFAQANIQLGGEFDKGDMDVGDYHASTEELMAMQKQAQAHAAKTEEINSRIAGNAQVIADKEREAQLAEIDHDFQRQAIASARAEHLTRVNAAETDHRDGIIDSVLREKLITESLIKMKQDALRKELDARHQAEQDKIDALALEGEHEILVGPGEGAGPMEQMSTATSGLGKSFAAGFRQDMLDTIEGLPAEIQDLGSQTFSGLGNAMQQGLMPDENTRSAIANAQGEVAQTEAQLAQMQDEVAKSGMSKERAKKIEELNKLLQKQRGDLADLEDGWKRAGDAFKKFISQMIEQLIAYIAKLIIAWIIQTMLSAAMGGGQAGKDAKSQNEAGLSYAGTSNSDWAGSQASYELYRKGGIVRPVIPMANGGDVADALVQIVKMQSGGTTDPIHMRGGGMDLSRFRRREGKLRGGKEGKDSIPVLAMPGEYFIKKDAVDYYGADLFEALNNKEIEKKAEGGGFNMEHVDSNVTSADTTSNNSSSGNQTPSIQNFYYIQATDVDSFRRLIEANGDVINDISMAGVAQDIDKGGQIPQMLDKRIR